MAHADLVRRMKDFFARQTIYCEETRRDLESLPADIEDETIDRIAAQQETHVERRQALEREFARLQAEWNAAPDLTEAEREEVHLEAHRAAEATERLAALDAKWGQWVDERLTGLAGALEGLHRGRAAAGRYGGAPDEGASFIDKKA